MAGPESCVPPGCSCPPSAGSASCSISERKERASRLCRGARRFFFTRNSGGVYCTPGATPGSPGRAVGSSCGPDEGGNHRSSDVIVTPGSPGRAVGSSCGPDEGGNHRSSDVIVTPGSPGRAMGSSCGPVGGRGGMGRLASAEGCTSAIRSSCSCIARIRALPA